MSERPGAARHRYWLVAVFAALMLSPPGWAAGALVAAACVALAVRAARAAAGPRAPRGAVGRGPRQADIAGEVLGADERGRPVVLDDGQLAAHGLILGASGAGKSTTLLRILTDQIRRGAPVVVIDLKGSPAFAARLATVCAEAGRPLRVWSADGPSHWNPLAHGNATERKDRLIGAERFTEPHYQRAAERYVQTVLRVLEAGRPGRPPTLAEVVALSDPHRLAAEVRTAARPLAERVQDYLATLTPDQVSAIRGFGTRLAILTESQTGPYLEPPVRTGALHEPLLTGRPDPPDPRTIDVGRALAGREVVLFSLNSSRYGKLAAQLGTLVIQDLVSAAGRRLEAGSEGQPSRAFVGIDEFSALGADHLVSLLARGREAGVSVLMATQELADLERAAPGLRDQVLGNTAVKIAHRQDVPSSAQTIAQLAGTVKTWEETQQLGGGLIGRYATRGATRRQVEQFLVHPNEIKSLRTGEAVVMTKLPSARVRTVCVAPPRDGRGLER